VPWDRSLQSAPKYKTAEHQRERKRRMAEYERAGHVECAQPVCVMPSRTLVWPEPAHLGHDDTGSYYIGLCHVACNVKDGAVRGNRRSRGLPDGQARRWAL
jgi:hypothetical protein